MAHNGSPSTDRFTVRLGARGRLVLPAEIRRRLSLREGDQLIVVVEPDGRIALTSLREQVHRCRGMLEHVAPKRRLVDELIRERREEARREDAP